MTIRIKFRFAVAAMGALSAGLATHQAEAQFTSSTAKAPIASPTLTITMPKIDTVSFGGGLSLPCTGTAVTVTVNLVGGNKLPGAGQVQVTRFASPTNQSVNVPYSLGVNERKAIPVSVPFSMDCTRAGPSKYTVKLAPSSNGWDGNAKDLGPVQVEYSSRTVYVDHEIYGGPHPTRAKLGPVKINGGLVYPAGSSSLAFNATVTGGSTTAAAGNVVIGRTVVSLTGTSSYVSITGSYSAPIAGTATSTIPAASWGISITWPLPKFHVVLSPRTGGWDGGSIDLSPATVSYVVTTWNVNTVQAPP